VFLTLTILIYGVFDILDKPFRNPDSPYGIVSLELAFVPYQAHEIISSWKDARWVDISIDDLSAYPFSAFGFVDGDSFLPFHYLFFGLGFDYLFMPVYALALSLGLLLASYERPEWFRSYVAWISWGVFAAAAFDAVENYALWKMLTGNVITPFPQIASACATIKFTLLIMGIVAASSGFFIRKSAK
jgi:uncharacterized protein YhhL (DUF1145 family)